MILTNLFTHRDRILITCPKKVAPILAHEVAHFLPVEQVGFMSVQAQGTLEDCMRLNLGLYTAHRVLFLIQEFPCDTPEELYSAINKLPWENIIPETGYFSIDTYTENEHILDTRFASLKCKDAIADRFMKEKGIRPDSGPMKNKTTLFLHWKNNTAAIYVDTSGETVAKHGYRKHPFKAPLIESLAATIILSSRWDKKSLFINPMCGSGTLAIEAALIAQNRAPGLLRSNYGFKHIIGFEEEKYESIRKELKLQAQKINFKIIATDISEVAIEAAKSNAETAGVDHLIDFKVCDFRATEVPEGGPGCIFFNPEYGERLGDENELVDTYKAIGDFMKKSCKGYTGYVFTGNMELGKQIGLKTSRRIEMYNSKIECRLLEFELYDGSKKINKKEN